MATTAVSSSAASIPPSPVTRISYTNRDYSSALQQLMAMVQATNPALYSDFFESNLGQMLMEQFALVVDLLSMGQDSLANEIFLSTCRRYESAIDFCHSVGYTPRSAVAASVVLKSISMPSTATLYGAKIAALSVIKGQNGLQYELQEDYNILAGDTIARITLLEGRTYTESYSATNTPNQEVVTSNYVVADQSWDLYVGTVSPANLWTQVDNVAFETGPTKTYDYYFDGNGAVHFRFGDGIAGAIPQSSITVVYRTTSGAAGNAPVGSIQGTLQAQLVGTGTVSVTFLNEDVVTSATGGTQLQQDEAAGTTVASDIQAGNTLFYPVSSGSLTLTINLPAGAGILQLQDNGDGTFRVVNNTTSPLITLLSSTLTYSTGAWSIVLSAAVSAGGPMVGTYYSVTASSTGESTFLGAATGGADRESLSELRRNVPAYIRSQGKIITLQDYEDVLPQLAGIKLVFASKYVSSYTANAIRINAWTSEQTTVSVVDADGTKSSQLYTRYASLQVNQIQTIQAFLAQRTFVALHNIILIPAMMWIDLYLGDVTFNAQFTKQSVQQGILNAVIGVFQSGTGFAIRLADLYNAIRSVQGVVYFDVERIATGTQSTSDEKVGQTTTTATVSGVLQNTVVTPGTVKITVEQATGNQIVLVDNGSGNFVVSSSPSGIAIVSSSVDYITGDFTVTFSSNLIGGQLVLASYANVTRDYRRAQNVNFNSGMNADVWPPPGVATAVPVITPPYKDGVPLSATRIIGGVITPVVAPYQTGDLLTYDKVQDILILATGVNDHFFDNTYQFNNEIYYDSVAGLVTEIRALNLRNLVFNLIAQA